MITKESTQFKTMITKESTQFKRWEDDNSRLDDDNSRLGNETKISKTVIIIPQRGFARKRNADCRSSLAYNLIS